VTLAVLGIALASEQFATRLLRERERVSAHEQLSAVRARLEGVLQSSLLSVHGLVAVIAAHPDIDQAEFGRIAHGLVGGDSALRNIVGAPDLVVRMVYPIEHNEAVLGLDYRADAQQREAVLRGVRTGKVLVAGPLVLKQGGNGVVVREPVFVTGSAPGEAPRLWGLVSAVIDTEILYRSAGVRALDPHWQLAIRGTDALGALGQVFFGSAAVFGDDPVTEDVTVPGGSWQLAAVPSAGWGRADAALWAMRLLGVLFAVTAGGLAFRVAQITRDLGATAAHLRSLLDTIPDLVWVKDPQGRYLSCNRQFERVFGVTERSLQGQTDAQLLPAEQIEPARQADAAAIAAGAPRRSEEWISRAGQDRHSRVETLRAPVLGAGGALLGVLGIARDITERARAQERIQGLNRVYALLSAINASMVRIREPERLFHEVCRIAVEVGGFRMAWIGLVDAPGQEVRVAAQAGQVGDYLEQAHISQRDDETGQGPTAQALRSGARVVCDDIATDPRVAFWRERALRQGYRSSIGLPIRVGTRVAGVFSLYAEQPGYFVRDELQLLDELALNIGFALEFMEAEEVLRRQRDMLNRTSRLAQVGGWQIDVATMTGSGAEETFRIHDMEPDGAIDISRFVDSFVGEGQPRLRQAFEAALRRGEPYDVEVEIQTARGNRKWIRTIGLPVLEQGRVVRIDGATQDISKRKAAEQQMRQGETILDTVFQALPDVFLLLDGDGTIRDYRASDPERLFVRPQQFLGRRVQDVLPPPAAAALGEALDRVREQGGSASCEYDLEYGSGPQRLEARLCRLPLASQVVAVVRNITSQYLDRRSVLASEARYRQLFLHNPAPMAIYELGSLRLLAVNQAFAVAYGYSRDEAVTMRIEDFFVAEQRDQVRRAIPQAGGLAFSGEWRQLRKDGSELIAEVHSHGIDYEGKSARLCVVYDITERKRMEAEVRRFNVELEERVQSRTAELAAANRELETFSYSVSHDLKAPLRGIDGYSRLLWEEGADKLDAEGRTFVTKIRAGVAQMSQLIEDLLAYSRADKREPRIVELSLRGVLDELLAARQAECAALGVEVQIDLAGATVRADPAGLRLVLGNLLDNAIKFSHERKPPRIQIAARAGPASTILHIRDNGIGFDMKFHDRIFDIFQRLHRAEDYPGTGIGLAIVRKAMQRMGGRVWAQSEPGQGATFYLELPR
jgi:PAS domain S-box-containing protein